MKKITILFAFVLLVCSCDIKHIVDEYEVVINEKDTIYVEATGYLWSKVKGSGVVVEFYYSNRGKVRTVVAQTLSINKIGEYYVINDIYGNVKEVIYPQTIEYNKAKGE